MHFVRDYRDIIESATPHLYLSALAQTPAILGTTSHCFTALPKVVQGSEDPADSNDSPIGYMVLYGHTDEINFIEFSCDGQYVATGSDDKTVRIWDTQTYSQVGDPLTGHTDFVLSACFSPDGKLVASTSEDGTVRIWNARSKSHEQVGETFTGHLGVEVASFLGKGNHIISTSYQTILFWNAATHVQIAQPLQERGTVFSVSPDGNCLALPTKEYGSDVEILDIHTGTRIGQLLEGNDDSKVVAVAFSPDGQNIVTLTTFRMFGTLQMWDAKTGALIDTINEVTRTIFDISIFPDKLHVMTRGQDGTQFWEWKTHSQIRLDLSMKINTFAAFSVLSPSGNQVASVSRDYLSVRIWNFEVHADNQTQIHDFSLNSASYSPGGHSILTNCSDSNMRIWDAETYSQVGNPFAGHSDKADIVCFSAGGKLTVTASDDGTVHIWDAETRYEVSKPLTRHATPVVLLAFSPDETCFISVSADKSYSIRVWSAGDSDLGTLIQAIEVPLTSSGAIQSVSFSPWNQLIAVNIGDEISGYGSLRYTWVLDLKTGREETVVPPEYRNRYVCFSPEEHLILLFGGADHNLHLWNVDSSCIKKVFSGHADTVQQVSFSLDGKHMVSASMDHTIRVWNTETSSQTAMYLNLGYIHDPVSLKTIEISPDGRHILSVYNGYDNDHVQIWAMPDSLPPRASLNYFIDDANVRI